MIVSNQNQLSSFPIFPLTSCVDSQAPPYCFTLPQPCCFLSNGELCLAILAVYLLPFRRCNVALLWSCIFSLWSCGSIIFACGERGHVGFVAAVYPMRYWTCNHVGYASGEVLLIVRYHYAILSPVLTQPCCYSHGRLCKPYLKSVVYSRTAVVLHRDRECLPFHWLCCGRIFYHWRGNDAHAAMICSVPLESLCWTCRHIL